MVIKSVRTVSGIALVALGIVFTIIPGSILFILAGLFLLSFDHKFARRWLQATQDSAARGARKLDSWLLRRKSR
ncbi:PGPGW domain-containing protein [Alteromonas sp. ASW11-36]|uniref:PGPGW domain-containing protein n=1 Tax=Alteromonas arenosi TaxID=3055817 RepID=A0ABT7SWL1_9ALTE|nr:PGPGW domain-containing protein [Alteromonas sp. ASW11-36]MDM7860572.1 PGPGW domain-containing protein [Alteromonas sp. ASW11-36]